MGLLAKLNHRLWTESDAVRRRRRLRQMVLLPPMMLAGAFWGVLSTGFEVAATTAIGATALGATAFGLGTWLYLKVQPALVWWSHSRFPRAGGWVAMGLDSIVVGSAVWLLTDVLALPAYSAVTATVTLGGGYAALVAGFFDDSGSRVIGGALGVIRGGGLGFRVAPFSHIETAMQREDHSEVRRLLEEFVDEHPGDARGWLYLGRLLSDEFDEPDEAIDALRSGVDKARLDPLVHRQYVATMLRIRQTRGEGHRVGRDLAVLAEAAGRTPSGDWARARLEELRDEPLRSDPADAAERDERGEDHE